MKKNIFQATQLGSMLFLLCCAVASAQQPKTHTVMVKPDGSFEPKWTYIHGGDTVKWRFSGRSDAIIPVNPIDSLTVSCSAYKPYDPTDPNEFTGPMPAAASGIFTFCPDGPGFVIDTVGAANSSCNPNNAVARVGNLYLCETGRRFATMDWTWQNPNITGVFIYLRWNEVHLGPGVFDWRVMDREIEKAVRNGKVYGLAFKAGLEGTPDWIFDPAAAGADVVKRLTFRDGGERLQPGECGFVMALGSPADPNYRKLYFDLWRAVAKRIRERNAWYRALAYVKPSGANLISPENRLPNRCENGCPICNPKIWAEQGGYTPAALYSFYSEQTALLASEFPDKDMSYMLIQAGFPLVNDNGEYKEPLTMPLPGPTEQTERILARGRREHGLRFVVQHNGLGVKPQDRTPSEPPCPNEGKHPAVPPFGGVGTGCPNKWVLEEGVAGQVTGFQTVNPYSGVATPVELESTFQNAWDNSDGIFVEIYEQLFWKAEVAGPVLDPNASGRTIADWANLFHERRRRDWGAKLGDPFPLAHSHAFKRTISSRTGNQLFYYINPSKCGAGNTTNFGAIVILPGRVVSVEEQHARGAQDFSLQQNYPNPFWSGATSPASGGGNPTTTIQFTLQQREHVTLKVFDLNGQEVATLINDEMAAGKHVVTFAPRDLAGGLYFYQLTAGKFSQTRKAVLMK